MPSRIWQGPANDVDVVVCGRNVHAVHGEPVDVTDDEAAVLDQLPGWSSATRAPRARATTRAAEPDPPTDPKPAEPADTEDDQ